MSGKQIISIVAVTGLIICSGAKYSSSKPSPTYTAKTLIRVLPYTDKDPTTITTAPIDNDIQKMFRLSIAKLIKQQNTLLELISREKVRQSEWFMRFSKTEDIRNRMAVKDLEKNLRILANNGTDYIDISMTCSDKNDAALIVNEMVHLFIASQTVTARRRIKDKMTNILQRRNMIQSDVSAVEKAVDDVLVASGFSDLTRNSYPHRITARLNRLERQKDDLLLKISAVRATINSLEARAKAPSPELDSQQDNLVVLEQKHEVLERLLNEARNQHKELNAARRLYQQRAFIRDERRARLNELKALIEKLRLMHDDPDVAKVEFVSTALPPFEADSPGKFRI